MGNKIALLYHQTSAVFLENCVVSYIRRCIKLEMVCRREIRVVRQGAGTLQWKIYQVDSPFGKELSQEIVNKTQASKERSVKIQPENWYFRNASLYLEMEISRFLCINQMYIFLYKTIKLYPLTPVIPSQPVLWKSFSCWQSLGFWLHQ